MHFRSLLRRWSLFPALVAAGCLSLSGCDGQPKAPPKTGAQSAAGAAGDDEHDHDHHHHSHGEKGPHGGALVAIGDDAAHLELVLEPETGKLTAYVLDASAQNAVPINAAELKLEFTKEHEHEDEAKAGKGKEDELPETGSIVLLPVEPAADGSTSVFAGESADLKDAEEFDAVLASITINGMEYTNVKFNYPEGNEHDHHHH